MSLEQPMYARKIVQPPSESVYRPEPTAPLRDGADHSDIPSLVRIARPTPVAPPPAPVPEHLLVKTFAGKPKSGDKRRFTHNGHPFRCDAIPKEKQKGAAATKRALQKPKPKPRLVVPKPKPKPKPKPQKMPQNRNRRSYSIAPSTIAVLQVLENASGVMKRTEIARLAGVDPTRVSDVMKYWKHQGKVTNGEKHGTWIHTKNLHKTGENNG